MKKALIIHHLEICWNTAYKRQCGRDFYSLAEEVISHLQDSEYDRVVLTQFENWNPGSEHLESGISEFVDEWRDYGYGWEREMVEDSDGNLPDGWIDGGSHSEVLPVPEWAENLGEKYEIDLCGAFENECIEDMEVLLSHVAKHGWNRVESLIV